MYSTLSDTVELSLVHYNESLYKSTKLLQPCNILKHMVVAALYQGYSFLYTMYM